MSTLDIETVTLVAEEKAEVLKKLTVRGNNIDYIDDLSACVELERLDASQNVIEEASGLKQCLSLAWLNLATNKLTSMHFVYRLKNLTVLNIGNNLIEDMSSVGKLTKLKALILNKNRISQVCDLQNLKNLNTLVLSHNAIGEIDVSSLRRLTKLQLSHNCLRKFPDITENKELKQLLLNDNKIHKIPARCVGENMRLEIIDIGKNDLKLLASVKQLSLIQSLKQLNLKGNDLCSNERYHGKIRRWFTNIEVLDSRPFSETCRNTRPEEQNDNKKRNRGDVDLDEDDDSLKKKTKTEMKTKMSQESPVTNGKKTKKKKVVDLDSEVVLAPDAADQSNGVASMNDELCNKITKEQSPSSLHIVRKPKGVSALKEKKSGVVAIKRVKKKHKNVAGDIIADITCSFDVGSGIGSSW